MAYVAHGVTIPEEILDALRERAVALDYPYGPTGTGMTTSRAAEQALGDLLTPLFPQRKRAMVSALLPGGQIPLHVDARADGLRLHLPLLTNPSCWVLHDGIWMHLESGHLYDMDPTRPHGAVNWGTTLRLHLLVDVPPSPRP